ncbi:MAG: undecaprenyldiphospho-muramoylpentapeptide beta-N-acetylglucosaminyltransferase [Hyphomicrobiales bacterium]
MSAPCVMLAAGGTGGHLFPAYAVAEELIGRGYEIDLITDMRGDRYGTGFPARKVWQVHAATPGRGGLGNYVRAGTRIASGVFGALGIIGGVKPVAVVGFGGYPSIPPVIAARLRGLPVLIQEQNAVMGRANRQLARIASRVALSFEQTRYAGTGGKYIVTGIPVRGQVLEASARAYEPPERARHFNLVVFGGSQGARFFSEAVPPALAQMPEELRKRLRVVQQCREEDLEEVRDIYKSAGIRAELAAFFPGLPARIAASHLVVARSGASTVAELAVLGRPAVLVPLPHALDNDQLENATRLAGAGGAWVAPQREFTPERFSRDLATLMGEPDRLATAAAAAKAMGKPDAAARLADAIEDLAGRGQRQT